MAKRTTHVSCDHCGGSGKVPLCHFCKGKAEDRNVANGFCDWCDKPFCWEEHGGQMGEDCEICTKCLIEHKPE